MIENRYMAERLRALAASQSPAREEGPRVTFLPNKPNLAKQTHFLAPGEGTPFFLVDPTADHWVYGGIEKPKGARRCQKN